MAAWAPLEGSLAVPDTARAIGSLLWIALIPGVVGPLLFFALIKQRGATRASSLLFVVPAVTAIAAWPILGTPMGVTTVLGLAIAAVGLRLTLNPSRLGNQRSSRSLTSRHLSAPPTPSLSSSRRSPADTRPTSLGRTT
jgi:drug/metabolite transporter (DMT)-like permease